MTTAVPLWVDILAHILLASVLLVPAYMMLVIKIDQRASREAFEAHERIHGRAPIRYAKCRYCPFTITQGNTQLEAWQAYAKHIREWHQ